MQLKILLADDEDNSRTCLSTLLRRDGYIVDTASDGLVAINKLKNNKYDLLITDVLMPHMDGVELVTRMLKGEFPIVPYLFLTVGIGYEAVLNKFGRDHIIQKPCKISKLNEIIHRVIGT